MHRHELNHPRLGRLLKRDATLINFHFDSGTPLSLSRSLGPLLRPPLSLVRDTRSLQ